MPHHSAQKRPMNSFVGGDPSPPPSMMVVGSGSPGSPGGIMPPRGPFVGMMPQGVVVPGPGQHPPVTMRGPPHPHVAMTTSWMPQSQQQQQHHHLRVTNGGGGVVHRVDLHGDETITEQTTNTDDDTSPTRSLKGESSSFDSSHEIAASVLLLAASAVKEKTATRTTPPSKATPTTEVDNIPADEKDRTIPLKKRKKAAADIMRKNSPEQSMACHVSPHSETSKHGSSVTHGGDSSATNTPTQSVGRRGGGGGGTNHDGSPTSSYDLKDGQALPDSAKITDTKDISPPTHVEIPHFPSVLHAVLTESEFAGKVLNWLPHGQSWKIVRWDALRRQVLPKYFSQLREEDSKDGSGSIDAFLFHLSAWGFEEVTDGPDAGAYSHVLFRRELPRLCHQMRFAPSEKEESVDVMNKYGGDRSSARSILQVPSLSSTTGCSEPSARTHMEERKKVEFSPRSQKSLVGQTSPGWPNHEIIMTNNGPTVSYRPELASSSSGEAWKFFAKSPHWVGAPLTTQSRTIPPYSPIRVRSGRGACRLPLNRNLLSKQADSASSSSSRPSFPVSNRGKGKGLRRPVSILKTDSVTSTGSHNSNITATSSTRATTTATSISSSILPAPQDSSSSSGAATTTRTTSTPKTHPHPILKKRKLPMMTRKPCASEDSTESAESSAAASSASSSSSSERQQEAV